MEDKNLVQEIQNEMNKRFADRTYNMMSQQEFLNIAIQTMFEVAAEAIQKELSK